MENEAALYLDRRSEIPQPGCHALIIGVSAHEHLTNDGQPGRPTFGMKPLEGPAASAFRIAELLLEYRDKLVVPLKSLRLLLSPAEHELTTVARLRETMHKKTILAASTDDVLTSMVNWQTDCESERGNVAFFYFAGHGLEYDGSDTALVCHDFGATGGNELDKSISLATLFNGMRGTYRNAPMASEQLFFVDCCRNRPAGLNAKARARDAAPSTTEAVLPCVQVSFRAAQPGNQAYCVPVGNPNPRTVFGASLLEAIRHGGHKHPEKGWMLSAEAVYDGMRNFARLAPELGLLPKALLLDGFLPPGPVLMRFGETPDVELSFRIVPEKHHEIGRAGIGKTNGTDVKWFGPPVSNQPVGRVPAGYYSVWKACSGADGGEQGEEPLHVRDVCFQVELECKECQD